jgi:hypothetical protein
VVHPEGVEPHDPAAAGPNFLELELALAERRSATKGAAVTIDDFDVAPLADGVRLVTYRATAGGRRSMRASIWVRRRGRWRLRFHQGTRAETEG